MVNPFLSAIKRPFKWASGSRPVDDAAELRLHAQRELTAANLEVSKHKQRKEELELQSARLRAEIVDLQFKEKKLVRSLRTTNEKKTDADLRIALVRQYPRYASC
jgi:chromosome segregation ATPase